MRGDGANGSSRGRPRGLGPPMRGSECSAVVTLLVDDGGAKAVVVLLAQQAPKTRVLRRVDTMALSVMVAGDDDENYELSWWRCLEY